VIPALVVLVFVPLIVEAVRSSRNERQQRARGGVEAAGDVYGAMRVAYPAAFLAMLLEAIWRQRSFAMPFAIGLAVFILAKALKWWAIVALGPAWTFRVIVVPGAPLVAAGPYRYLRHPNYVGVVGELIGVALMTSAWIAGPITLAMFGALLARRISLEERALGRAA